MRGDTNMTTPISSEATQVARPQRADARRNRARILDAARGVLAEHGVEAGMDEIARRADLGVGTLYRHFPTKEALVDAIASDHFAELAELAGRALEAEGTPGARFNEFMWSAARRTRADAAMAQVMAEQPQVLDRVAGSKSALTERVDELVRQAVASGELRPDATGADVPAIMCGLGSMVAMERVKPGVGWERYLTIALDGLRHGAPGA